jgi:hypothetical protein
MQPLRIECLTQNPRDGRIRGQCSRLRPATGRHSRRSRRSPGLPEEAAWQSAGQRRCKSALVAALDARAEADLSKGGVLLTDQKPAKSVEDGVSPYLQEPLRSLEQAEQDRKRQQRQTADAQVKER